MQLMGRNLVTNESRENFAAAADKIHLQHRVDVGQFKLWQFQRKEQTLLRSQTLFHRLGEADLLVVILKIVEFHALSQLSCASRVETADMDEAFIILQIVLA